MTDCPLPTCGAVKSVDEDGFCSCCGKVTVRPSRVELGAVPPRVRKSLTATGVVLCLLIGSCASNPPAQESPEGPQHYMIPLAARNQDYVCAETLPKLPNYCMTVQAFRQHVLSAKAGP